MDEFVKSTARHEVCRQWRESDRPAELPYGICYEYEDSWVKGDPESGKIIRIWWSGDLMIDHTRKGEEKKT